MRLTQFAFALTLILLAITGYLAWEGQQAARGAREELQFVKKQQVAQEAATPGQAAQVLLPPAPAASITPPPPAPGVVAEPPSAMAGSSTLPGGGLTVPKTVTVAEAQGINTNTLTATQKLVLAAKPVARVKTVVKEQGFVVLAAGSKQGITKGQKLEIRRDNAILAKITVADTVEADEAVADLDLASVPTGVTIEPGDEVIEPLAR